MIACYAAVAGGSASTEYSACASRDARSFLADILIAEQPRDARQRF